MTAVPTEQDSTMEAITRAVTLGRSGDVENARRTLMEIWGRIGVLGDPLHRCTLAHHLADLYDDPARALVWDVRALDAADALTDERAQAHHPSIRVAGFYPSLHLNIADNLRRLGAFDAASEQIEAAHGYVSDLPDGAYGNSIRTALGGVADDITRQSTERRPSAPAPGV